MLDTYMGTDSLPVAQSKLSPGVRWGLIIQLPRYLRFLCQPFSQVAAANLCSIKYL